MCKSAVKTGAALAGALVLAGVLAGCGAQLRKAEQVPVQGPEFTQHLYDGYIALAQREFTKGDYFDSDYFATRAMRAARGEAVPPEALEARSLPEARRPDLAKARAALLQTLESDAQTRAPKQLAGLQVAFDCWMQEQEEVLDSANLSVCRASFSEQLANLQALAASWAAPPAPGPIGEPTGLPQQDLQAAGAAEPGAASGAPKPLVPEIERQSLAGIPDAAIGQPADVLDGASTTGGPGTYIVFFGFDEVQLDETAVGILSEVVRAAQQAESMSIVASGHADRVGPVEYNEGLAKQRAEAVARFLVENGVEVPRVRAESFGERLPLIDTGDEAKELQNRRVEIRFLPSPPAPAPGS